jgi:hypothetical protein
MLSYKGDKIINLAFEINFLGLQISFVKIILEPHVLEHMHSFPYMIKDKTQLQQFLGCINYVSPFYLHMVTDMKLLNQSKKRSSHLVERAY